MKRVLSFMIWLLVLGAVAYVLYQWLLAPVIQFGLASSDDKSTPKVIVSRVHYPRTQGSIWQEGVVLPIKERGVTSPVEGKVVEIFASTGQLMETEAPIFRIDNREAKNRLLGLQAKVQSLADDDTAFDEALDLSAEAATPTVSKKPVPETKPVAKPSPSRNLVKDKVKDKVEDNTKVAPAPKPLTEEDKLKQRIASESDRLANTTVKMPYRALVKTVMIEVGSMVQQDEVVLKVDAGEDVDVKVSLPPDALKRVRQGQTAMIESREQVFALKYQGRVIDIVLPEKPGGASYLILRIPRYAQPQLSSGQSVQVQMALTKPGHLAIPRKALHFDGNQAFVYFVRAFRDRDQVQYQIKRKQIVIGKAQGQWVSVLSGLQPGDLLAIRHLREGQMPLSVPVRVQYDYELQH